MGCCVGVDDQVRYPGHYGGPVVATTCGGGGCCADVHGCGGGGCGGGGCGGGCGGGGCGGGGCGGGGCGGGWMIMNSPLFSYSVWVINPLL